MEEEILAKQLSTCCLKEQDYIIKIIKVQSIVRKFLVKNRFAKPKDKSINPIPNFTGPDGLCFDCQIFDRSGAKTIIKNEFKIANHDAGTSVASFENSLPNIQITIAQIITKLDAKKIFDKAYFSKVFLNNR